MNLCAQAQPGRPQLRVISLRGGHAGCFQWPAVAYSSNVNLAVEEPAPGMEEGDLQEMYLLTAITSLQRDNHGEMKTRNRDVFESARKPPSVLPEPGFAEISLTDVKPLLRFRTPHN